MGRQEAARLSRDRRLCGVCNTQFWKQVARWTLFCASCAILLPLLPAKARACEPPSCWGGHFIPSAGAIPSNAPFLVWQPHVVFGVDEFDAGALRLLKLGGETETIPFELMGSTDGYSLVKLYEPLQSGRYQMVAGSACGESREPKQVEFAVEGPAPLPTGLGSVQVQNRNSGVITIAADGECSTGVRAAQVEIKVQLSESAKPWRDLLMFSTWVDGEEWRPETTLASNLAPGSSWNGRGRDLMYAICDDDEKRYHKPDLSFGKHEVVIRASLPGGDQVFESEVAHVDLHCPGWMTLRWMDTTERLKRSGCSCDLSGRANFPLCGMLLFAFLIRRRMSRRFDRWYRVRKWRLPEARRHRVA